MTTTGGSAATKSYGYDASGNSTSRPGQTLTWTPQGKIASVVTNAGTQSDVYTADGSLLLQTDPVNGSTLFIGETQLHVAAGSSVVSAVRDYAVGGATTAERTTKAGVSGSALLYLMTDANGTAYEESNTATGVYQRRFNDPYGTSRGPATTWSSGNGYLNKPADVFDGLTQIGAGVRQRAGEVRVHRRGVVARRSRTEQRLRLQRQQPDHPKRPVR